MVTKNKDGVEKNIQNVKDQFAVWQVEMGIVGEKIMAAYHNEKGFYRIRRMFHHATGYLEESIDQLTKLWFYTWVPKYTLIAYLIWPEEFQVFFEGVKSLF